MFGLISHILDNTLSDRQSCTCMSRVRASETSDQTLVTRGVTQGRVNDISRFWICKRTKQSREVSGEFQGRNIRVVLLSGAYGSRLGVCSELPVLDGQIWKASNHIYCQGLMMIYFSSIRVICAKFVEPIGRRKRQNL